VTGRARLHAGRAMPGRNIARGTLPRAGLALAAGALVAASVPPFGIWPLGPAGVGLLAVLLAGRGPRSRALIGLVAGIAQFAVGCTWALAFTAAGYVGLVAVQAVFTALACAVVPPGRGRLLALAGALTLAEWVRDSWPLGGMPLGGAALGQAGGPLLALARAGGPLLVAAGVFLAGAGVGALASGLAERHLGGALAGGCALVLVAAGAGAATFAPDGGSPVGHVRAALVQGGGRRGLDQLEVPASTVFAASLDESRRLSGPLDVVLWPEDVVRLGAPLAASPVDALLGALAHRLGATLLAGVTEPVGATRFRNEIVAWGPTGHVVATFEKVHPVPFGEYVPFRSLLSHLFDLADVPRDAVRGHGSGMIATPAGRFAVLVSYETFFAERGRAGVRAGAELMVVPTNTASYATSQVPSQELAASRLQAVGEGRDLLQAATTGFTAEIDQRGDVLARTRLGVPALLRVVVPLRRGATLYERFGDLPVLVLALLALLAGRAAAFGGRRGMRRRRDPGPGEARVVQPASIGRSTEVSSSSSPSNVEAEAVAPAAPSPDISAGLAMGAGFLNRIRLKRTNLPIHMTP